MFLLLTMLHAYTDRIYRVRATAAKFNPPTKVVFDSRAKSEVVKKNGPPTRPTFSLNWTILRFVVVVVF